MQEEKLVRNRGVSFSHQSIFSSLLKIFKWDFQCPTADIGEMIRVEMLAAKVRTDLVKKMFSADFQLHSQARQSLSEVTILNSSNI
jgi:hypothetical protein